MRSPSVASNLRTVPSRVGSSRILAWAVPLILVACTLMFFLVMTRPRAERGPSSHEVTATFIAMVLITLIPLGTLVYHLAARRTERAVE